MLTLDDLGVLRDVRAARLTPSPSRSRRPTPAAPRSRPSATTCARALTDAGYAAASRCARCCRRRGAPTGSPTQAARSSPSTASPRPDASAPAPRGRSRSTLGRPPARVCLPALRVAGHRGAVALRPHRLHRAAPLHGLPRAVRAREGDLMTLAEAPARTGFHTLRVAGVERLCDDAVAVTFDGARAPAVGLRVPARGSTSRCGPCATASRNGARTRSAHRPGRPRGSACVG